MAVTIGGRKRAQTDTRFLTLRPFHGVCAQLSICSQDALRKNKEAENRVKFLKGYNCIVDSTWFVQGKKLVIETFSGLGTN